MPHVTLWVSCMYPMSTCISWQEWACLLLGQSSDIFVSSLPVLLFASDSAVSYSRSGSLSCHCALSVFISCPLYNCILSDMGVCSQRDHAKVTFTLH